MTAAACSSAVAASLSTILHSRATSKGLDAGKMNSLVNDDLATHLLTHT